MSDDFFLHASNCELSQYFLLALVLTQFTDYTFDNTFRLRPFLRPIRRALAKSRKNGVSEARIQSRGLMTYDFGIVYKKEEGAARARTHFKSFFFEPKQLIWLQRLKAAVEADGRKFVFLRFPVRPEYAAIIDEEAAKGNDVWSIYKPYYEGCLHLDYFKLPLADDLMRDADHLNEAGARYLTRLIEPEFVKLLRG